MNPYLVALFWSSFVLALVLALGVIVLVFAVNRLARRIDALDAEMAKDRGEREVLIGEVSQAFSAWDEAFKFDGR
jgi:ABC-type multidrug transport system fused ATPase/permease subunit